MNKSKWTDSTAAKEIISRIAKLKLKANQSCMMLLTHNNYKSAFDSAGFDNYLMLLKELVRFDGSVPESLKQSLVKQAVWRSADDDKLHDGYVSNMLKIIEAEYLEKPFEKYNLVTGVSIVGLKRTRVIKTSKAIIKITNSLPKKFKKTYDFKEVSSLYPKLDNKSYSWVVVEVNARCIHSAAEIALEQLDYWRGIFNLYFNYNQTRTSFHKPSPINKISKYPYHSIHLDNGDRATPLYWFDQNFNYDFSSLDVSGKYAKANVFYKKLSRGICNSGYISFFINILNRYSTALDTTNMNSSFLAMWSLLESLTFSGQDNYDVTIARTLVLFTDKFKVEQELKILRNKRNMAIHSGNQFEEAEKYAYILMNYIHEYIFFLVNAISKSESIEHLKATLDLPLSRVKLTEIRKKLKSEIKSLDLIENLINIK
ncbi:hypothetical protein H5202_09335 [Shewanella sp. SG41-4]|uniref:hypothetical protein n=1 Tax=Shewanella sp. SG41-4 TaxID=2760976 RepID=UPI001601AA0D|nr:hypothetical protein [Shewanella sp. SG41-4]MBB1438873.1 hypothetical protein [Shewanella sp. SG41-4]